MRILLTLLIITISGCGFGAPDNAYQPPPPPEVTVAKPVRQTVTLFLEENGETEAVEQAEVRARVQGFLEEIRFEPGKAVSKDDILYTIEQAEYIAAVNSAKAAVESAEAAVEVAQAQIGVADVEVERAEVDFQRYAALLKQEAATQSQYDQAKAARNSAVATKEAAAASTEAAKAELQKANANLEQAQLDLDYTSVKAPIAGRISKTEIKQGNLVENGSPMATVIDRSQMYVNFNLSDRDLLRLQRDRPKTSEGKRDYRDVPAYLRRELDEGFPFEGHLDYVDETGVDQATGTLAVRAIFENPDDLIVPGLFVRIRVPIGTLEDALLIPERAVARDQTGSFVLIVNAEKKVEQRPVTTGQTFDGMVVVEKGLEPADSVILDGSQRARPGTEVTVVESSLEAPRMTGNEQPTETEEAADTTTDSDSAPSTDEEAAESAQ